MRHTIANTLRTIILVCLAAGVAPASDLTAPGVETDVRLHSEGKGWKLDQARIVDASLPRVLLVGDSILSGYLSSVKSGLKGKAYVDAWVNGNYQSDGYNKQLGEVLETLTDREKKVLQLRFGLNDGKSRTLEDVGQYFGVTRERIRQIEAKALRKLRHPTRIKKLRDFLD